MINITINIQYGIYFHRGIRSEVKGFYLFTFIMNNTIDNMIFNKQVIF